MSVAHGMRRISWQFEGWSTFALGLYFDLNSNFYSDDDGDYIIRGVTFLWWSVFISVRSKRKSPWIRV